MSLKTIRVLRNQKPTSWTADHKADCGVVLTGGRGRIREGLDLLYQGQIRKLIISGVHPGATLLSVFSVWPYYASLREDDVVLEKRSQTTYGNAQQSLVLIEALKCKDLVLVTSALHMPRAFRTFRKIYPQEIAISQRSIVSGRLQPTFFEASIETLKLYFYSLWVF